MPDGITIQEAQQLLGLGKTTVRRLADEGRLGVLRLTPGGHRRVSRAAVEAYAEQMIVGRSDDAFPIQFRST